MCKNVIAAPLKRLPTLTKTDPFKHTPPPPPPAPQHQHLLDPSRFKNVDFIGNDSGFYQIFSIWLFLFYFILSFVLTVRPVLSAVTHTGNFPSGMNEVNLICILVIMALWSSQQTSTVRMGRGLYSPGGCCKLNMWHSVSYLGITDRTWPSALKVFSRCWPRPSRASDGLTSNRATTGVNGELTKHNTWREFKKKKNERMKIGRTLQKKKLPNYHVTTIMEARCLCWKATLG